MNSPNSNQAERAPLPLPDRESQIAAGTVLITAQELAPRLGLSAGKQGAEKVRLRARLGLLPVVRMGARYMFHWPTVVDFIHRPGKSRVRVGTRV